MEICTLLLLDSLRRGALEVLPPRCQIALRLDGLGGGGTRRRWRCQGRAWMAAGRHARSALVLNMQARRLAAREALAGPKSITKDVDVRGG